MKKDIPGSVRAKSRWVACKPQTYFRSSFVGGGEKRGRLRLFESGRLLDNLQYSFLNIRRCMKKDIPGSLRAKAGESGYNAKNWI